MLGQCRKFCSREIEEAVGAMRALADVDQPLPQLCECPMRACVQLQAFRQDWAQHRARRTSKRLQQHAVLTLVEIIAAGQVQQGIVLQHALTRADAPPAGINHRGKRIIHDSGLAQCRGRSTCRPDAFHSG